MICGNKEKRNGRGFLYNETYLLHFITTDDNFLLIGKILPKDTSYEFKKFKLLNSFSTLLKLSNFSRNLFPTIRDTR